MASKTEPHPELKKQAADVAKRLKRAIPKPRVELDFENAWQLLVATILAAQSTDKKINEVTPALFARFPTPAALGYADEDEVEAIVKPTGFFRNKAKAIMGASRTIADEHGGEVPRTMEELTALPGVARKTANVVLGSALGIPTGIVVDTHVKRVSRRLELTVEKDPPKIERELCGLFAKRTWIDVSHRLVLHGRYVCQAKKPRCARCPLNEICAAAEAAPEIRAWTRRAAWEKRLVESKGAVDELDQSERR
jgi:endonuclease-3